MIIEQIKALPDESSFLNILSEFDKLLKKYARLLSYDDAYEDLRLFFIELLFDLKNKPEILKNDGIAVSYISTSIKNHYFYISKNQKHVESNFSDLSDEQMVFIDKSFSYTTPDSISDYFPISKKLTELEAYVITMFYTYEFPISTIAKYSGKSRQAVNQAKLRALKKIKESYI